MLELRSSKTRSGQSARVPFLYSLLRERYGTPYHFAPASAQFRRSSQARFARAFFDDNKWLSYRRRGAHDGIVQLI